MITMLQPTRAPEGNANIFPLKQDVTLPQTMALYNTAKRLHWDPTTDIPFHLFDKSKYSKAQLDAGRWWWSHRAWIEFSVIPAATEALKKIAFSGLEAETKNFFTILMFEEARHVEVSAMLAEAMGGYMPEPEEEWFKPIIGVGVTDAIYRPEVCLVAAAAALHCFLETLSTELFKRRFANATDPVCKEVVRLVLQDETRHGLFGWVYLSEKFTSLSEEDKRQVAQAVEYDIDRGLQGMYSTIGVPAEDRAKEIEKRRIATEAGFGGCTADEENMILCNVVRGIRKRLSRYGIHIREYPELERFAKAA